jgi:hypothetical protein
MKKDDLDDLIERYILNKLNTDELTSFENQLTMHPEWRIKVEWQKTLKNAMNRELLGFQNQIKMINKVHGYKSKSEYLSIEKYLNMKFFVWAILFTFLILFVFYLIHQKTKDKIINQKNIENELYNLNYSDSLYSFKNRDSSILDSFISQRKVPTDDYIALKYKSLAKNKIYDPFIKNINRSGNETIKDNDYYTECLENYYTKNYKQALAIFDSITFNENEENEKMFLLAMINFKLENYVFAYDCFKKIENSNIQIKEYKQWNLLMTLILLNKRNTTEYNKILSEIINSTNHLYNKEALYFRDFKLKSK